MDCPEHKVLKIGTFSVWLYWRDVPRNMIPLKVWGNPFRYEVSLVVGRRRFEWNSRGLLASRFSHKIKRWKGLFLGSGGIA